MGFKWKHTRTVSDGRPRVVPLAHPAYFGFLQRLRRTHRVLERRYRLRHVVVRRRLPQRRPCGRKAADALKRDGGTVWEGTHGVRHIHAGATRGACIAPVATARPAQRSAAWHERLCLRRRLGPGGRMQRIRGPAVFVCTHSCVYGHAYMVYNKMAVVSAVHGAMCVAVVHVEGRWSVTFRKRCWRTLEHTCVELK